MKFIHTADLHLDSALCGVADGKKRRSELVSALKYISDYAENIGATGIIVAGDLFDEKNVADGTIKNVAQIIADSNAEWYIVQGNHGAKTSYDRLYSLCPKVHYFGDEWTTYQIENVVICGKELDSRPWQNLPLSAENYNIVVLHGDVDDPSYGTIDKKMLATSPVNYVALGHRHSFSIQQFGKVFGAYSGTPEPRGFDEAFQTGFVVIDTSENKTKFVPHAIRSISNVTIDISNVQNDVELQNKILSETQTIPAQNYLNLTLIGVFNQGVRPTFVANEFLEGRFFALRVKDQTKPNIDIDALSKEVSLRGEFVALVQQLEDENLKQKVLAMGLNALSGGEL